MIRLSGFLPSTYAQWPGVVPWPTAAGSAPGPCQMDRQWRGQSHSAVASSCQSSGWVCGGTLPLWWSHRTPPPKYMRKERTKKCVWMCKSVNSALCFTCYLVGVVHEVNWDAEWQWMVVRVPQQDGHDLHAWRFGFPLSILQRSLQRSLTVHSILPHLIPKKI